MNHIPISRRDNWHLLVKKSICLSDQVPMWCLIVWRKQPLLPAYNGKDVVPALKRKKTPCPLSSSNFRSFRHNKRVIQRQIRHMTSPDL